MKEDDYHCPLPHQVLAGDDVVETEEDDRNEPAQSQTRVR